MDYQYIRTERKGGDNAGWTILTIAREQALNALGSEVLNELHHAVQEVELDDSIRAVILTGAGKAFVAGADIAEMTGKNSRQALEFAQRGAQLGAAIEAADVPFIAAVNGFALGGGCELALACDFIYASETARFGQPEVKLGVIPGFGGTQRLPRRVGVGKAKELIFTGAIIKAADALQIGLVDRICPANELLELANETAAQIASNGPLAIGVAKHVIHQGLSMNLEQGIELEMHSFASLFGTADQHEGMSAFIEKRQPKFEGE